MAEIITHTFVSAKTQSVDPTLVSKNEWNDGHILNGGVNGQRIVYDNTQPDNVRWTDGVAIYSVNNQTVPDPTSSPYNNAISIPFTTQSPAVVIVHSFNDIVSAGEPTATLKIDSTTIGTQSFPASGATGIAGVFMRLATVTAGVHAITVSFTTVGNTNITGDFISLQVIVIGI